MSVTKANRFIRVAKENGWETRYKIINADAENIMVTATRGPEKLVIEWAENLLTDSPDYQLHEMHLRIHSRLDAERKLKRAKPDYEQYHRWQKRNKPKLNDSYDPKDPLGEGVPHHERMLSTRELPFDPDTDDDSTILKAIRGNTLVFVNSVSGNLERVHVPWRMSGGKDGVRVFNWDLENVFYLATSATDRDYVSFMDSNGIFRAVHLDRLVGVV